MSARLSFFASVAPILLVLAGCSGARGSAETGTATRDNLTDGAARPVSCTIAENCASGQHCTVQSKGECIPQGDVCTGVCEAACEGLTASECLADARCEPELAGCPVPPPNATCSAAFIGCKVKVALSPCADLAASECLADARCEPKLAGCGTPPPGVTCSPAFIGCQSKQ